MNLALHGLLLQVIVSIVQFQHGFRLCSAGEPGYLDFDNLPETNFSCQGKVIGGYYADVEAGCQMFHVCTIGQKDEIMDIKFLCLNGTVFDQETRVCERVDEVDCSKSERFYNLNLELYGNNAVTLSLHDTGAEDEDDPSDLLEDHESQRTTSSRPSTTTSTTTTTPRPSISSTTSSSGSYQHQNGGYPQHFQPQPRFPSVQTSQSKSLYDDKNGGYHHQYIYHTGDHRNNNVDVNHDGNNNNNNNNQATSYQLFSNQGVSSTTGPPQIHQIRYSSTPSTQIQIRNDHQPTVSPIFHATSSTIQTLLNSNANSPALINPIFHNHGISSTTEQFTVHNNNPRETPEYRDDSEGDDRAEEDRRPLEALQPTTQGKVSKLTISPPQEGNDRQQGKNGQLSQQQRITTSFLPTPASDANQGVRSFYPTPRTSTKSSSSHVTHIHLPPPPSIPQLKPHQVTINLPPPDIQRIVQNPSPLLPSQSRVIVTAKASVSDESGRPLNSTQLVTLPLPTIPASYDDYKEGDESFDPFYRDVPKVRNGRRIAGHFRWTETRDKRSVRTRRDVEAAGKKTEAVIDSEIADEKADEISAKEESEIIDDKGTQDKDVEIENHLKTMTSKHRIDTEAEDEEKTAIDTRESDEEEIVELDGKSKPVADSRETDAEEYVNAEGETFDSKIFEEPGSKMSKEVEIRAVAQQDSKYSKNRSHRLDKEVKNSNSENSNTLASSKRQSEEKSSRFPLSLPEVVESSSGGKHSSKKLNLRDDISESKERVEEELEEEMEEDISHENSSDDYYYYDAEFDDSNHRSNEGDSAEHSKESPNKISSKHETSRHSKSSKKILNDDDYYDFADDSTTQSNEQIFSDEMSGEYEDSRQNARAEDSREVQDDEAEPQVEDDNTTQKFIDETTTSNEQIGPSEKSTINDDTKSYNEEDHYSEGILKFTDEIPRSEKAEEPEEPEKLGTVDETPQDYVDDNYEPQSYKEQKRSSSTTETITTLNIADDGNTRFVDYKDSEDFTTAMSPLENVGNMEDRQNDEAQPEKKMEVIQPQLEKSMEKSIESDEASTNASPASITENIPMMISTPDPETTTTEILTTTPATTTTISTITTTTSTTPSTTTTSSTTSATTTTSTTPATITTTTRLTTPRATPSRLLKPFTIRKNYVYIPPTTTPVPVIIKPRLPLLNPKPAKPIKSYNDYAPKPIIRKSPLFARKALITRTTTPYEVKNLEDSTEIPAETTETPKIEESTLSLITTEFPTTQAAESSTPVVTTLSSIREDEKSSIKDNNVPISLPDSVSVSSATESQTFTPYPMLRMTEATSVAKETIPEEKKDLEAISTSEKAYVESNDVPNVSEPENSSRTPEVVTLAIPEEDPTSKSHSGSSTGPHKPELISVEPTSDSSVLQSNVATNGPEMGISLPTTSESVADEATTEISEVINRTPTLASIKAVNRRPGALKRTASFNCLEKEMYRFYADGRDCRLFHYCSPGFTSRQVLDFRFVCEEGTAFDEETQSCIHDVKSPKCRKRVW